MSASRSEATVQSNHEVPRVVIVLALLQLPLLLLTDVTLSPPGVAVQLPLAAVGALGLLVLFGGTLLREATPGPTLAAYLLGALALGISAYLGWLAADALWGAALVLTLAGVLVSYGLHRYERVVLGLAGGDTE
jgi:hypothetical protein